MDVKGLLSLIVIAIGLITMASITFADPQPTDTLNSTTSGSFTGQGTALSVPAQAGNVTALLIEDIRSTNYWQGYYGNITGRIVLDDANNNTLFAWELPTPSGEIYAVNTSDTVLWDNVTCINFSHAAGFGGNYGNQSKINMTTLNSQFGISNDSQSDALNATFNSTFTGTMVVGPTTITAGDNCPQANTFQNEAYQQDRFREILLFDNQSALIFATIIENSVDGYQVGGGDTSDFQMIVFEDGSPGGPDEVVSTYWFYVELE